MRAQQGFYGLSRGCGLGHAISPDARSGDPGLLPTRQKPRFGLVAALGFHLLIDWLGAVFPPSKPTASAFFTVTQRDSCAPAVQSRAHAKTMPPARFRAIKNPP